MNKILTIILYISTTLCFAQKWEIQNQSTEQKIDSKSINKTIKIELNNGNIISGELISIDEKEQSVILQNASSTTEIKFNRIYKIHSAEKQRGIDQVYRIDVPERFFYTPMGNTIPKGMVSLENFSFLNNSLKVGITHRIEAGIGFTLWQNDDADSSASAFPMATFKYKYINRRHFKATVGVTSLQFPPIFTLQSGNFANKKPWFSVLYTSANWEYKYATLAFSMAQPYLNTFSLRNSPSITNSDDGLDYMFSASFSLKVFPFAHLVSENIFLSGAWNTLGKPNKISRETYLIPLIGGRYYGDYYSFAGGVSNVLIPNAVFFFYIGGSYFFD